MTETILKVDGMACGMCESHINDTVRNKFSVQKVTSSHTKGETVILSEQPLDQQALRDVVAYAVQNGIPVPTFSAAVAYYDSYRAEVLPANLIQAQRDYFGAHTYKRTDKEGVFHTEWMD